MNTEAAYEWCEAITRHEAKNFSYGIRLLKKPERYALSAIYAMARRIDDVGDGSDHAEVKLAALQRIRHEIQPINRRSYDPVLYALEDAARRFELPMGCFDEIIQGCEMDVHGTSYETIDDLVVYCRKVAGSVGRLSLAVFDPDHSERAVSLADDLGVALQLTNILRDVVEDQSLGRVYLPREDAERVQCAPDLSGPATDVARLVAFECTRATEWYARGLELLPLLSGRSKACVSAMAGIYERLLVRIERDPLAVTRGRISLSTGEKVVVAVRSLAGIRA